MRKLRLEETSLRSQRAFIYALVETIEALRAIDGELPNVFITKLESSIGYLTRVGLFPEGYESDRQGVRILQDYLLALRRRCIEHYDSLTPAERERLHENRALFDDLLDHLGEAEGA